MEVKINLWDKILFAFFNFVVISSLQKCSRQKKFRACRIKKGSQNLFDDIFLLVQVTHENGESAKKIQNNKFLKEHPSVQWCTILYGISTYNFEKTDTLPPTPTTLPRFYLRPIHDPIS